MQQSRVAILHYLTTAFGEYNQLVQEVAGLRGQTLVNWDFDSRDAAGATGAQSLGSYNSLIASRPSSILTLNHEITASTPQILPEVIRDLQAAGYRLTTLADCLGESPYQWVDEPQERDVSLESVFCRLVLWLTRGMLLFGFVVYRLSGLVKAACGKRAP